MPACIQLCSCSTSTNKCKLWIAPCLIQRRRQGRAWLGYSPIKNCVSPTVSPTIKQPRKVRSPTAPPRRNGIQAAAMTTVTDLGSLRVGLQHPPLLLINMDCAVLRSVGNLSVTPVSALLVYARHRDSLVEIWIIFVRSYLAVVVSVSGLQSCY